MESLARKCAKARRKLAHGSGAHTRLGRDVKALRLALALLRDGRRSPAEASAAEADAAVQALAAMRRTAARMQARFAPGTPQHTLQKRRAAALRLAERRVRGLR